MKTQFKLLFLFSLLFLISCAPEHIVVTECVKGEELWGFWGGLWHGSITPITWLVSLLNPTVEVWAVNNNGGWYAFGFVIGIGSFGTLLKLIGKILNETI